MIIIYLHWMTSMNNCFNLNTCTNWYTCLKAVVIEVLYWTMLVQWDIKLHKTNSERLSYCQYQMKIQMYMNSICINVKRTVRNKQILHVKTAYITTSSLIAHEYAKIM